MKKFILSVGIMSLMGTSFAIADDMPARDSVSIVKVAQNLESAGYKNIREIKFDDGKYEAKVVNSQGNKVKLKIDPKTGEVPKQVEQAASKIDVVQALEAAQKEGCQNISKVEHEHKGFEVKCKDKDNKKYKVVVDSQTGKAEKKKESWFD